MTATPTRFIRASIVNEGKVEVGDVLIARDGTIGAVGAALRRSHSEGLGLSS